MDKVKAFLAVLQKYHFWVLAGLVFILSFTGWYLASADLEEQYTQNRTKIKGEFEGLNRIVSVVNHPNAEFEKSVKQQTAILQNDVKRAWEYVYSDQQNMLKWPEALGDDFLDEMATREPTDEIRVELRERYLNYVKEEFPRLLKIVDARPYWVAAPDQAVGPARRKVPGVVARRMAEEVVDEHDYLVTWESKNQEEIDAKLDFPRTPSTQEVLYCQENLWVYRALLDAIAKVNTDGKVTGHHNARIKEILTLAIGQEAAAAFFEGTAKGRIVVGDGSLANAEFASAPPPEGGAPPPMMEGEAPAEGAPAPGVDAAKKLDDNRYVDAKGIPLSAGSTAGAEFKRMPVLLRLWMDQREISTLLVELANLKLPVEIHQLRLNPKGISRQGANVIMFGGGEAGAGVRKGPEIVKRGKEAEELAQYPYDIAVEMHGVIYIFNPPDKKLLIAAAPEGETPPAAVESPPAAEAPATEAATTEPAAAEAPAEPAAADATKAEQPATEQPATEPQPAAGDRQPPAEKAPAAASEPTATGEPPATSAEPAAP